jgi:hypothetical protein
MIQQSNVTPVTFQEATLLSMGGFAPYDPSCPEHADHPVLSVHSVHLGQHVLVALPLSRLYRTDGGDGFRKTIEGLLTNFPIGAGSDWMESASVLRDRLVPMVSRPLAIRIAIEQYQRIGGIDGLSLPEFVAVFADLADEWIDQLPSSLTEEETRLYEQCVDSDDTGVLRDAFRIIFEFAKIALYKQHCNFPIGRDDLAARFGLAWSDGRYKYSRQIITYFERIGLLRLTRSAIYSRAQANCYSWIPFERAPLPIQATQELSPDSVQ